MKKEEEETEICGCCIHWKMIFAEMGQCKLVSGCIDKNGDATAKSRHITIGGYTSDCEKYNLAVLNGWRVFRYTAISYRQAYEEVSQFINKHKSGVKIQ